MEYIKVIDDLSLLLNTKHYGKGKKGFNVRDEFKGYLRTLKEDFNKEISTQFLFNLMKDNHDLKNKQKRQKIRNLIRDSTTEKQGFYIRGLEVLNYRTDIIEYGTDEKQGLIYPQKHELTEEEEQQLNEIENIKNCCGVELVKRAEHDLNERRIKQNAFNGFKVVVKNIRTEHISKEFVTSKRKNFNFINVD